MKQPKGKHLIALALLALPALLCAAPLPETELALQQKIEARILGDRTGACLQAALIDKGQVLRARVCAGTRKDPAPAPDAAFEIGSVTKTMTAYLVQGLVASGKWSLDDPIAKHLPEGTAVPRQGERQILVRDLLTHSSGLPGLPPGMAMGDMSNPYATLTEAQLLASLAQVKLARAIGSQAEYSNYAMMLLSLAVARSLGGDYEAALREQLFKPLGMGKAYVSKPAGAMPAAGHLPTGEPTPAWTIATNLAGVGMVKATLADMESYARAQLGEGPAAPVALMRQTQHPLAHGFAMNWMRRSLQGRELVMHEGGTGGFSSLVALEPGAQRGVVLLADTSLADLGGLSDLGLALLGLDGPALKSRKAAEAPAALRKAMAGEYELAGMKVKVWEQGDKLMAQATGQGELELRYDSYGDFYPQGFSALLRPQPPVNGVVERFAWRQMGGLMEGRRVGLVEAAPSISNAAWRDWAGEFQLMPQFSLKVFERDGRLMVQGTGQPAIAAEATGKDRIEIKAVGAVVEFERDGTGQVVAAVLLQGGQKLRGAKK
ncbi:serine hydrolase domain-containing protein [Pelomonas sp. SE-A7]|uniref:serine hydrolase domain-containing protein n=1 Tax=Pelomonas sp. SE-A7 TaxID=3054953 RepID=UPI00259CEDAE|nr:serine hydrolase domain-containing protein [Pelomonas sp. SE-A7]MDM4767106.1 serine hydrolase domain-containing protein [Pelomonas sp. SE-A7]